MGYEHDMDDYYEEKWERENMKRVYKIVYTVPAGTYTSDSLLSLLWEIFTHRLWHWRKGHGWKD